MQCSEGPVIGVNTARGGLDPKAREAREALAAGERQAFLSRECPPEIPIVGQSPGIRKALATIRVVAQSRCNPVLILGETGTGKELAARAVHVLRCGKTAPFVGINCAALTANLLESELFGHVKGAFTGAQQEKAGLFEAAGAGTVLLDEISEMPLELQAKLLRVLQEHTFRKVGGTRDIACNATIVASSNRDLFAASNAGGFRRDLYYRLAVFPVTLPALRSPQRREDIALLAEYFLRTSRMRRDVGVLRLSREARAALLAHDWPGNVRELRNVIERAVILTDREEVTPDELFIDRDGRQGTPVEKPKAASDFSLATAEREFILRALEETNWQRTRAAALLGITRATLHAKLKRYDIQPPAGKTRGHRSCA